MVSPLNRLLLPERLILLFYHTLPDELLFFKASSLKNRAIPFSGIIQLILLFVSFKQGPKSSTRRISNR
jgi:hypothetical protein